MSVPVPRRTLLGLLAVAPAGCLVATVANATEYASAAEVFDAIDGLEAAVSAQLRTLGRKKPLTRDLVASFELDYERHRADRSALRTRLRLPAASIPVTPAPGAVSLDELRTAVDALVYAHAEGMPALGDTRAVDVLAHHMIELSRQLTVVDLWIEQEKLRG